MKQRELPAIRQTVKLRRNQSLKQWIMERVNSDRNTREDLETMRLKWGGIGTTGQATDEMGTVNLETGEPVNPANNGETAPTL